MQKIAIIGGGAAGLMACATIIESGHDVELFLIEKNSRLGKKVLMTGGGRCNVTTGLTDIREILKNYPRGAKFLRDVMYNFPPTKMIEWVESHGVAVKIEKTMKAYPKSDKSEDIVKIFEKILAKGNVKILFDNSAETIKSKNGKFTIELSKSDSIEADKVIITTGSAGYKLAESLGHSITPLAPSLSGLVVKENWIKKLSGVSFKDVKLRFVGENKFETVGDILFTHKGLSGPGIFEISSLAAHEEISENSVLFIDFFPKISYEKLSSEISKKMERSPTRNFEKILGQYVPRSFASSLCDEIGSEINVNKIVEALKNLSVYVVGRIQGEEFVTAGGVELSEVNPKTMESKICPGLYLAGEVLDIDGFTGGFNLQAAWATGRLAGKKALI